MAAFIYPAFRKTSDKIRLIEILPGSSCSDDIKCDLIHASLSDLWHDLNVPPNNVLPLFKIGLDGRRRRVGCAPYHALSYA
jgi:hypothetical protein